jgi:hypothetical protein
MAGIVYFKWTLQMYTPAFKKYMWDFYLNRIWRVVFILSLPHILLSTIHSFKIFTLFCDILLSFFPTHFFCLYFCLCAYTYFSSFVLINNKEINEWSWFWLVCLNLKDAWNGDVPLILYFLFCFHSLSFSLTPLNT